MLDRLPKDRSMTANTYIIHAVILKEIKKKLGLYTKLGLYCIES
jgi:hypothetical protein